MPSLFCVLLDKAAERATHFLHPETWGALSVSFSPLNAVPNVLPILASTEKAPKLEAHPAASGGFAALEKHRKLAFTEQVRSPARQLLLPISTDDVDNDMSEE